MKGTTVERPKGKVWTYEEYLSSTEEGRYELINGRLERMPAPSVEHQRVLLRLYKLLDGFVGERIGEVLIAPVDVVLSQAVVVQPDLVLILRERFHIVKDRIFGPPDLVVEVISPNTVRRDTSVKKGIYAEAGVKEYWIVYPEERAVEVWVLKGGSYYLHSAAEGKGKVKSEVLEGFELDVKEVFP